MHTRPAVPLRVPTLGPALPPPLGHLARRWGFAGARASRGCRRPRPGEGVTYGETEPARATLVRRGPRQGLAKRGEGPPRPIPSRPVASRPVPSRPARHPPYLAAAWSASRQSRPLAQDVSHIRISASVGSRAVPVRAGWGELAAAPPRTACRTSLLTGGRLPPLVTTFFRGSRRRAALRAALGVGRCGSVAGGPPAVASGVFPVTLAGGYKREAPRGTAERASAAEYSGGRVTRTGQRDVRSLFPPSQGRSATAASPRIAGLRDPSQHDVPGLRRRVRGTLFSLQQRFTGRGQPHLLPLPGRLFLQHGLAR